jgi:nucleotide-binding universal stress UspA family protein
MLYRNIIVGYDGSDQAEDALTLGKQLVELTGGFLTLAGVLYLNPWLGAQDPALERAEAEHVRRLEDAATEAGAKVEKVLSTSAARGLHRLAEVSDADLIVVGSSHRGRIGQVLAGSVGVTLLHGAPCPVAIAPRGYADKGTGGIAHVTVGFDGSPEANMALADAVDLARAADAPLKVVTVAEPPAIVYGKGGGPNNAWQALTEDIKGIMRERLDEAVASLPEDVRVESALLVGGAAEKLVEAAGAEPGVMVVGSRGYGPARRVLLGSASSELVRSTLCPVIVHPRSAEPDRKTSEVTAEATA